jgi:mono/diheme cytochrome c family protein
MICPGSGCKSAPRGFERADVGFAKKADRDVMELRLDNTALLLAVLIASLAYSGFATAQSATPAPDDTQFNVEQLFATTCGFCHSSGGRAAGKGPQLMNSQRDDDFIRNRIKNGKEGAMPAFGETFSDAQIDEIVKYIRALKPREG